MNTVTTGDPSLQESRFDVVIGAGPVGTTIARQLAEQGRPVRLLTRSGSGPRHPLIDRRRADAQDGGAMSAAVAGAAVVYDCMHASAYRADTWRTELFSAERAVLAAAGETGATVVFPESLYSFGRVDAPITETTPRSATRGKPGIRAELLAARDASATRTISVAAGDFYGPGVGAAGHAGERMVRAVLGGRTLYAVGDPDAPHAWTFVPDLATAMITAARLDRSGRDALGEHALLLAPTAPAVSQRQLVAQYADAAGVTAPRVVGMPGWMLRAVGTLHRDTRELAEMTYQFDAPFTMDSRASQALLGLEPTPLRDGAAATIGWWRERSADGADGADGAAA
jgi:nucleoside-diphosphate-sugar epimerase